MKKKKITSNRKRMANTTALETKHSIRIKFIKNATLALAVAIEKIKITHTSFHAIRIYMAAVVISIASPLLISIEIRSAHWIQTERRNEYASCFVCFI